jgi:molybdate transport system substrate-binding protein
MSKGTQTIIILLLVVLVIVGGVIVANNQKRNASNALKHPVDNEKLAAANPANDKAVLYAPCGMNGPITAALIAFRKAHPQNKININFYTSPVIISRIKDGDRPDGVIAPGELEIEILDKGGFIDKSSVRDFATLELAIIAPKKSTIVNSVEDLTAPKTKRIAMANPAINSPGFYGEKALRALGIWDRIKDRMVLRDAPLEPIDFVTRNEADAAIVYLTCPLETAPEKADKSAVRIMKLPRGQYPPVRCQIALLKNAGHRDTAQLFIDFIRSDAAQKQVAIDGLLPIKDIK